MDAEARGRPDHHVLEPADVLHEIGSRTEVDDRIADELSGAVVGHLPAAVGFHDLHAAPSKRLRVEEHLAAGAASSDRVDVRVLEEEQGVVDLTGDALHVEVGLQRGSVLVVDEAEPADV
jgi:hypothetical protein